MTEITSPHSFSIDTPQQINEENQYIPGLRELTRNMPKYSNNPKKKTKRTIAKFFSDMSRFGMSYDDDVIANMRALPGDKTLISKQDQFLNQDLFQAGNSAWKVKQNADKGFFDKDLPTRREALRRLAVQPELEDILDTMTNESIVYDSDYTYFCDPFIEMQELQDLKKSIQKKIETSMSKHFRSFYKMLAWKTRGWDDFKRFLIEGVLAWEIVWDSLEKPKNIIGLVPIDPATLTKKFDNNKWYWVQFKGMQGRERILLDAQVIYITYQETNSISRQSYLERLIRPYNIYRIVEQAQLIWTVTNSSFKMKFTIPVRGMTKSAGKQTLSTAKNEYKENIDWNIDTGELQVNGSTNLPFQRDFWFPESDSGSPQMDVLGGDGPDLNDNDQLKYFKNQLYKISKIPLNRFDQESGETWFGTDATSVARTEIDFARFVTRLRNTFAQIMIKPLQLQLACDFPELRNQKEILEAVSLRFNSYNVFEELLEISLLQSRMEFIQSAKDSLVDMDTEGNEIKFWSSKFLVERFLKLSKADLDRNAKLKKEEIEDLNLAGDPNNGYDDTNEQLDSIIANLTEQDQRYIEAKLRKKRILKNKENNKEES